MALTDEEFRAWCQRNKIEPETITYIQRFRSSEPAGTAQWSPLVSGALQTQNLYPNTEQRRAMGKTTWEVVGGERK